MLRRSKRLRGSSDANTSDDEGATSAVKKPIPHDYFALLPQELKSSIVRLACTLRARSSSSSNGAAVRDPAATFLKAATTGAPLHGPLPGLDVATTLSIARVSRCLYALATPLIFSHVWLTRPSQLASFSQAIAARPPLGRLVKSLHVGPDNEMPDWYYPLFKVDEGDSDDDSHSSDGDSDSETPQETFIQATLRSAKENSLLPQGCHPEKAWSVQRPKPDRQSTAIYEALATAQRVIDVSLHQTRMSHRGENLGGAVWDQRMHEAHAVFELYLIKCRHIEEQGAQVSSRRKGQTSHSPRALYPPLILLGYPRSVDNADAASGSAEGGFTLTRTNVLRHLLRPGAITDRFDHPLLFARSGIQVVTRDEEPSEDERMASWRAWDNGPEDMADLFAPTIDFSTTGSFSAGSYDVLDLALPSAATLGSLLGHLRSVLSYTPLLYNLSLTDFLQHALCGRRSVAPLLLSLRSLSLEASFLNGRGLSGFDCLRRIENLRLVGDKLWGARLEDIAPQLTQLKELQWQPRWDFWNKNDLLSIIARLLGGPLISPLVSEGSTVTAAALQQVATDLGYEHHGTSMEVGRNQGALPGTSTSLVEAQLHPQDVVFLLDNAPSAAVRAAWQSGYEWRKNTRRLLLIGNRKLRKRLAAKSADHLYDGMHLKSREWWEKQGGLVCLRDEMEAYWKGPGDGSEEGSEASSED